MASCGQLTAPAVPGRWGKWQIGEKLRGQTGEKSAAGRRSGACRVTRRMRTYTWSRFSSHLAISHWSDLYLAFWADRWESLFGTARRGRPRGPRVMWRSVTADLGRDVRYPPARGLGLSALCVCRVQIWVIGTPR